MNCRASCIFILVVLCVLLGGNLQPLFGQEAPKKVPVKVRADKLDYDKTTDVSIAEGHVRIEQDGFLLDADKATLDNKNGNMHAEGNVYVQQQGEILRAERLDLNINTRAGVITNGEIFMVKDNYHMKGAAIEKSSDTVFRIEEGTITTCDENDWYLKAREIVVDMDRYATASHVSFNIGGLPLFYSPYFLFPVRRQTGLLIPEIGVSSSDGFLFKDSLFWAISDFQDMTFTLDYRHKLGIGTGIEYRYVNSRESAGKMSYNYFDKLDSTQNLWELRFQHREEIADDLSLRIDIKQVGVYQYYRVLEKKLEPRGQPYLDSNAFYVERWDAAALSLNAQYSMDLTQTNQKTLQKLPELRYVIFPERVLGPLYMSFDGSAVNFSVQDGYNTRRADFNPQLALALSGGGLGLTPRVGMRGIFYDRSKNDPAEPTDLKYIYGGVDLNARISRIYGTDDGGDGIGMVRHSIEPTLSYEYIPRVDTTDIPQFDSLDTVSRKNLLTFSLINRLSAQYREGGKERTYDMMIFTLSQSYDYLVASQNNATAQDRSEIGAGLVFSTPALFSFAANGSYNTYTDHWTSTSQTISVNSSVFLANLSHQYTRSTTSPTEYFTGGAGLKLSGWNLYGGLWYDLENSTTTQKEYRFSRVTQCWSLGLSYIMKQSETQYLMILELKGLGSLKF